jgi:serine/threonine-protein phosphatase 5
VSWQRFDKKRRGIADATVDMNKVYGFEGEAKSKHGEQTYKLFADVFTSRRSLQSLITGPKLNFCSTSCYTTHIWSTAIVDQVTRVATCDPVVRRQEAISSRSRRASSQQGRSDIGGYLESGAIWPTTWTRGYHVRDAMDGSSGTARSGSFQAGEFYNLSLSRHLCCGGHVKAITDRNIGCRSCLWSRRHTNLLRS